MLDDVEKLLPGIFFGDTVGRRHDLPRILPPPGDSREWLPRTGEVPIALFGSTARGTARVDSDILVSFDGPVTSQRYVGVQFFLEDLQGRPVGLVTGTALRAELRPFIEIEAVDV